MDVENISIKTGNNIIHIKHCNKRPKQAKHNLLNYFSRNTNLDTEAFTDEIGMIHNEDVRLLTDQVVENIDISDGSNIADEEEQAGTTFGSSTTTVFPNEDKVCKGFMISLKIKSHSSEFTLSTDIVATILVYS